MTDPWCRIPKQQDQQRYQISPDGADFRRPIEGPEKPSRNRQGTHAEPCRRSKYILVLGPPISILCTTINLQIDLSTREISDPYININYNDPVDDVNLPALDFPLCCSVFSYFDPDWVIHSLKQLLSHSFVCSLVYSRLKGFPSFNIFFLLAWPPSGHGLGCCCARCWPWPAGSPVASSRGHTLWNSAMSMS